MNSSFRRYAILVILGMVLLWIDFFSKAYVYHLLPLTASFTHSYPYGGIGIFQNFLGIDFSIGLALNKGAAWGAFANFQHYLLGIRMALILGMLIYLVCFNKRKGTDIALVFIIAGALGNVTDYFLYGQVVDFLHFSFWGYDFPMFNIADSLITLGVGWLILSSFFSPKRKETE